VSRPLALAGEALLWVIGIVYLLRTRVVRDERRRLGNGRDAAGDAGHDPSERQPARAGRDGDPVIDISVIDADDGALASPGIGRAWPRTPNEDHFDSVDDVTIGAAQRGRRDGGGA
jgi:hypothetical protein